MYGAARACMSIRDVHGQSVTSVEDTAKQVGFGQFLLDIVPSSAVGLSSPATCFRSFLLDPFRLRTAALGPRAAAGRRHPDVSQILFKMIGFVMVAAPIGAFGAIAFTVGKYGVLPHFSRKLVAEFYVCAPSSSRSCSGQSRNGMASRSFAHRYVGAELLIVMGTSSGESVFLG